MNTSGEKIQRKQGLSNGFLRVVMVVIVAGVALAGGSVPLAQAAAFTVTNTNDSMPGDLDPSFGTGGLVTTEFAEYTRSARAVVIQPDGKIVVVGSSGGDFAIARYNADGSLDTSFGSGGKVTTDIGVFDEAYDVAIQADGKIVAVGSTAPRGFCCQFALARYNPDGSLDTSFHGDGRVTTIFGGLTEAFAVIIQQDGKIVAAGSTFSPFAAEIALARYNTDGSLDTSFDGDGKVTTNFGGYDSASGIAIQTDGKIVVAGKGGPASDFVLARYKIDGSLDTSFDGDGKVMTDFGDYDAAADVAIQADGKIVAAGVPGSGSFALARYNVDGSLDASFDGDGKLTTDFGGDDRVRGVSIQADGKIVAVGFAIIDYDKKFALVRYKTDGSLDPTFGTDGKVTTDFGDPGDPGVLCPPTRSDCSNDIAEDVAIQSDGKIVAVGGAGACVPPCKFALARYFGDPITSEVATDICLFADRPGSDDYLDIREGASVTCDVWSNSDVRIKPGASVIGDVVSRFEDVNLGMDAFVEGDVMAGEDVKVREISTVQGNVTAIGDDVRLLDGAEVLGNATAGDEVRIADTAQVTGDIFEGVDVLPPPVLSLPSFAVSAGGEDIRVASGETLSLSPGSYGKLRVREGATLSLRSGYYAFTDVKVGPSAYVLLDLSLGSLLFDVSGDLSLKEWTQMEITSEAGSAADIVFRVTGEEVDLRDGGYFLGTYLAPYAEIELHEDASLIGALFGWEVDVEQRTTVVGMPAMDVRFPAPFLLTPVGNAAILQNDPDIGCAANPDRGYGFRIFFDWTDSSSVVGIARYDIFAKHENAPLALVNTFTTESEFTLVSCNGFVIDSNLEGWEWRVRTKDSLGNFSEWTSLGRFRYGPCRVNGVACTAPP